MTLVFGIAPAVAPVLGGVMLNVFGWRAIFWMLLALVAAVFVWASLRLPETLPRAARQPLHPRALWRNYRTVLLTRRLRAARVDARAQFRRLLHLHRRRARAS